MQRRRRPRALTLTLPDSKRPVLAYEGKRYTLRNISEEGIGLWFPTPAPYGMTLNARINADILIDSQIYPVELQVVHFYPRCVGLRIIHKSPDLAKLFHELLEPANYAATLIQNPASGSEDVETGYARLWLSGSEDAEVVVWYNAAQRMIMALQACWLGKYVYREQFKPVQTGFLLEESRGRNGSRVKSEELLLLHPEPDAELLHQAAQFLTTINPPVPGYLLWQFLETGEQVYLPAETSNPIVKVA